MELSEKCVICSQPIGTSSKATLGEKGSASINKASKERNETIHCTPGQQVHLELRNITILLFIVILNCHDNQY